MISVMMLIGVLHAAPLTRDCPAGSAWTWNAATNTATCVPGAAPLPATVLNIDCPAGASWKWSEGVATCTRDTVPPNDADFAGCPADAMKIGDGWGESAIETAWYGDFKQQTLSIKVHPPANWNSNSPRSSSWVEYVDGGVVREATFSTRACDFGDSNGHVNTLKNGNNQNLTTIGGTSKNVNFSYKTGAPHQYAAVLTPGQKYYINVRNILRGEPSCNPPGGYTGSCNMRGSIDSGGSTVAFEGCDASAIKIDNQWGQTAIETANWGNFGSQIMAVRIAVPSNWSSNAVQTSSWAEYATAGAQREAILSHKACSFADADAFQNEGGWGAARVWSQYPSFAYKRAGVQGNAYEFIPGQVYYINMRNRNQQGQNTCGSGACNMRGGLPQ